MTSSERTSSRRGTHATYNPRVEGQSEADAGPPASALMVARQSRATTAVDASETRVASALPARPKVGRSTPNELAEPTVGPIWLPLGTYGGSAVRLRSPAQPPLAGERCPIARTDGIRWSSPKLSCAAPDGSWIHIRGASTACWSGRL